MLGDITKIKATLDLAKQLLDRIQEADDDGHVETKEIISLIIFFIKGMVEIWLY